MNNEWVTKMEQLIAIEKPDIVFTHWPIDSHKDQQAASLQQQKRNAVFCHISQNPDGIYSCGHASMEDFRGREMGVKAAEAFVHITGKKKGSLIPGI